MSEVVRRVVVLYKCVVRTIKPYVVSSMVKVVYSHWSLHQCYVPSFIKLAASM